MNDINEILKIELFGYRINTKKLYELIEKNFLVESKNYDLELDDKIFEIQIEKTDGKYIIKSNNEISYFFKKEVLLQINGKKYTHNIFCLENISTLLNYYNFKCPYILGKNQKYKLNMNTECRNLSIPFTEGKKLIIEEELKSFNKFLLSKDDFYSYKNSKIHCSISESTDKQFTTKDLGKYATNYLKNISEDEILFFMPNDNMREIQNQTLYVEGEIFNFLTGSEKGGKTFSILCLNIFEENNYRIYFNDKFFSELEEKGDYQEILKVFFYEILKIFKNYDEYIEFSKLFFEKLNETEIYEIKFKPFILKFIDEIEKFAQAKKYEKIMIIFDDYELDEKKKKQFQQNYNFINELYEKRGEKSFIHFTFIALLNENYIKDCVIFNLEIEIDPFSLKYIKKDEKSGRNYFPFIYIEICFYNSKEDSIQYQNKIKEKNKDFCNISEKYLNYINYSLYHLNNIKILRQKKKRKKAFSTELSKYIRSLENKSQAYISDFYDSNNLDALYVYDLDKIKEFHELISNEETIKHKTLIEILKFLPIRTLNFYYMGTEIGKDYIYTENSESYKISYRYEFYKNSINKYLSQFENACYEKKNVKPGEKGDLFEKRVIESIKNGYFENFKPEKIIDIEDIYSLCEYKEQNYSKYEKVIELFEKLFSEENVNIIMIKQKKPNARRYDLAFLQKLSKGKYQLILAQITTRKDLKEMKQYTDVKYDCFNLANFFAIFKNVVIDRYHFLFIFKGGLNEDKNSMEFCENNDIYYIKYCEKGKEQFFLDSDNKIINQIIFDQKNFTLVECIKNYKLSKLDNLSYSSEYSLIGKKRTRINEISRAKYYLGINIYNVVFSIFDKKNFELCEEYYSLEEEKIFKIYVRHNSKNQKVYFLEYLKNGKKKVEIIKTNSSKFYRFGKKKNLNNEINKPGTISKCFRFLNNDDMD